VITVAEPVRFPRLPFFYNLDQAVHHDVFGAGKITAICGCTVTVAFCDQTRDLDIEEVVTRPQAEEGWHACMVHGANHRLEEGRWLWIVRSLCPQRGDWKAFLNKWGVPRSSAYDLIQRYLQERLWESQHASGIRTDTTALGLQDHANTLNAGRKRLVDKEKAEREGRRESQGTKYTYWNLRINLPDAVTEDCREKYKEDGDDGKAYWVRAAYRYVDREDELESGSEAVQENGSSDE
jgi:hypothetical protein